MKNRVSFLMIVLLVVAGVMLSYAESQEKMLQRFGRDVTKEMPLAEAVANFNQKYPDANPLTEEEVIASIRDWDRKAHPVNDATYAIYLRVAEECVLPRGIYLSRITVLQDSKYLYEVDWKDLTLTSIPQDQKDPETGFGYNYRIRARFISSRPLTAEEKEERKNQLKQLTRSKEINREMIEKEKQKDKNLQSSTTKNAEDKFSYLDPIISAMARDNNVMAERIGIETTGKDATRTVIRIKIQGQARNLQELNAFQTALETKSQLLLTIIGECKAKIININAEKTAFGSGFSLEIIPTNTTGIQKDWATTIKGLAPEQDLRPRVSSFLDNLESDSWEKVFSYLTPELRKKYLDYRASGATIGHLEQAKILTVRIREYHSDPSDPARRNFLHSEAEVVLSYKVKTYYGIQEGVTISNWIKESPKGEWFCTNIGIPGLLY